MSGIRGSLSEKGMLEKYMEDEKVRSYRALMSGHSGQDYYLCRFVNQPSRWKGMSSPHTSLRRMQCRNLFMVVFDNAIFLPMRFYRHCTLKIETWLAEYLPASQARLGGMVVATMAFGLMLILAAMISQEYCKVTAGKEYSSPADRLQSKPLASHNQANRAQG